MKKSILMLGLAVAAMTSCTNDEVLEQNQSTQKAIGFESFVNKGTRAVTETTSAITKFYAFGYYDDGNPATEVVFNGTTVSRTDANSSEWTYDLDANVADNQVAYWTKNVYQFAGYANGNDTNPLTFTGDDEITFGEEGNTVNLTIPQYVVSDQNDLVAAITTVDNSSLSNEEVDMNFKHLLTKIQFSVKNNDSKYKMRITSALVVKNVYKQGKCVVSKDPNLNKPNITTVWTPAAVNAVDYSPFFTSDKLELGASKESVYIEKAEIVASDELFVMPQDLANIQIQIKASFYDGNNQEVSNKTFNLPVTGSTVEVTPASGETPAVTKQVWAANTFYNYIISLPTSATPIEFGNITVDGWITGDPIELNTGNIVGE